MASGKPMVVTDVRGNNDLVTNNENGFLVTINDKVEMANKLKLIYKNNKQFEYMGENSFQKAKIFSLNVALNETISLYKDIVNSN
jgi:glycosyltransferase EpsD